MIAKNFGEMIYFYDNGKFLYMMKTKDYIKSRNILKTGVVEKFVRVNESWME